MKPSDNLRARAILLSSAGLIERAPRATVESITAQLGYVQIDTIYVVERAHHHILWSRMPNFRPLDLVHAQKNDKSVFEYWTHALSYIPSHDFKFFIRSMREFKRAPGNWYTEVTPAQCRALLKRIEKEGPISIDEIDEEKKEKDHEWASKKPSKRVLQYLFYSGQLTISERVGMRKKYELTKRHFGWKELPKPASKFDEGAYMIDRALNSQGLVNLESITYLDKELKKEVAAELAKREKQNLIVPFGKYFTKPEVLEKKIKINPEQVHLLSPFDPLVIQRKRLKEFFDFDYLIECYVPAAKRKFGYYVLPILIGDQFVGRIDLKAHRDKKRLAIQSHHWENGFSKEKSRLNKLIDQKLHEYEQFCFNA